MCLCVLVVLNSQTHTDYVLGGLEFTANSDSWAGNWWDPAGRTHQGPGPSRSGLRGRKRPPVMLDEEALMAEAAFKRQCADLKSVF